MSSRSVDVVLFTVYAIASVAGLLLIKSFLPTAQALWQSGQIVTGPALNVGMGAVLYLGSFGVWLVLLSRNELSVAYPVAIGLTVGLSALGAHLFLGETISTSKLVGTSLILAGIWIISCL